MCELPGGRGVNPAACNNDAILVAAAEGHVDVVRYLCELPGGRGVNPAAGDNYAIDQAAKSNHLDVVRYLCDVLPPESQHIARCASQAIQPSRTAQYLNHIHTTAVVGTWKHQPGVGQYTLLARMSARRPLLALCCLVRERRCGRKQGMCGMDHAPHMSGEGRLRRTRHRRRTR